LTYNPCTQNGINKLNTLNKLIERSLTTSQIKMRSDERKRRGEIGEIGKTFNRKKEKERKARIHAFGLSCRGGVGALCSKTRTE
jgi:hypothetical protein